MEIATDINAALAAATATGALLIVALDASGSTLPATVRTAAVALSLPATAAVILQLDTGSPGAAMFGQVYPIEGTPAVYILRHGRLMDTVRDSDLVLATFQQRLATAIALSAGASILAGGPPASAPAAVPVPAPVVAPVPASVAAPVAAAPAPIATREPVVAAPARAVVPPASAVPVPAEAISISNSTPLSPATQQRKAAAVLRGTSTADAAYLREIREQIARDRQNQAARQQQQQQQQQPTATEPVTTVPTPVVDGSTVVNLAIRQLDGTVARLAFEASDTIASVTARLAEPTAYALVQTFPRRRVVWSPAETQLEAVTLAALDLAPSATLVMRPTMHVAGASAAAGGARGVLARASPASAWAAVVALVYWAVGRLEAFVAWALIPRPPPSSSAAAAAASAASSSSQSRDGGSGTGSVDAETVRQRRLRTLADLEERRTAAGGKDGDDDDPKTSYNGNSTSLE
ncbi:hypothetical protein BC828DRAFT_403369 [Blastocladiella britannica]|nr:hypothetical protein BC828DRAFT_403369 [Blastocladiella britannica]